MILMRCRRRTIFSMYVAVKLGVYSDMVTLASRTTSIYNKWLLLSVHVLVVVLSIAFMEAILWTGGQFRLNSDIMY